MKINFSNSFKILIKINFNYKFLFILIIKKTAKKSLEILTKIQIFFKNNILM